MYKIRQTKKKRKSGVITASGVHKTQSINYAKENLVLK